MKKTNILKAAIAILAGASLFTLVSCDNLNQLSEKESEKAYLRVSLSDEARTILPYSGVTEFTDFKLSYYDTDPDTGNYIWPELGTYASYAAFEKAEIELPKEFIDSTKTFKLEAKKGTLEFSATNSCAVTYGENSITFTLVPLTLGTGKGGFNYTLDFSKAKNARDVVSAEVYIEKLSSYGLMNSSGSDSNTIYFTSDEISGNKIVVAKDQLIVPEDDPEAEGEYPYAAGSYQIKVTLYADEDNNVPVIIWSDIIQVAAGQVSTGSSEVSSLNEVYTISFNTNGGTAVDPVKVSIFTSSLSLPAATKEGNLFVGWYEDSNLTTPFAYTKGAITEDKTLYAKFMSETNADGTYNATSSSLSSLLSRLASAEAADAKGKTLANPATVKIVGSCSSSSISNALGNNSTVYVNLDLSQTENLTSLSSAFYGCSHLTSVILPASVTSIDSNTFYNCDSLSSITVDSANTYYKSVNGVLYSKDGTTLIKYPARKTGTSFAIPSGVKIIYRYAFQWASNINSITLPDSSLNLYYSSSLYTSEYSMVNSCTKYTGSVDAETYILNNTNLYYFCLSDKNPGDEFVETVTVYTPETCNTSSLNISDGTYTIVTDANYKYAIATEVGKIYTINWCDNYNRQHGYAYTIEGNNWTGFNDCRIKLTDSSDSTFEYTVGGDTYSNGNENDDGSPITFNGNGNTITLTVNRNKCAFRVWAQASSGSGE